VLWHTVLFEDEFEKDYNYKIKNNAINEINKFFDKYRLVIKQDGREWWS